MQYRNDGNREEYIIQNQFTAYLQVALKRRKREYNSRFYILQKHEQPMEPDSVLFTDHDCNDDYYHRIEQQAEYIAVLKAMDQLHDRERFVLIARSLEERSFEELAKELQIGYKGVAAIYYRAIRNIRKKLEGEK